MNVPELRLADCDRTVSCKVKFAASVFLTDAQASRSAVTSTPITIASPGYGLLNARMQWHGSESLRVYASIENLLEKSYRPHLAGFNRVAAVDIPAGEPLYGFGRNLNLGIGYRW